ncbi:TPA: phosphoribosylformylglycinamidine cyclo-ligase [Candidatus Woesearchaeota archaeon]|nr:phosphoribosylformylglycinamidine cyclo-ligase [Candidatus Woesearchaeota archaeon]HIH92320.1 phosphoribosylformylglycinamidine cyclo-ligase [Candidatus Woesearchaeota archaeon]HII64401.1 phosphoribosylformylglycinamidine cyclo-ligase [Candidatus Woesearchaeota archaeon]
MATQKGISYEKAGVDINVADATKKAMAKSLETGDKRVLNRIGAFASLFDGHFPGMKHPILVLKTEEPGSKQKLAFSHDRIESVCEDMVNHLINDIAVMGAAPLSVQDCIVCGKLEKEKVARIVDGIASACRKQGCVLTGGETSEQPGVVDAGTYILTSSIVGVVEKEGIIDGSAIQEGDIVLAISSNGLHTNGYSLVRALLKANPGLENEKVSGRRFIDALLAPHLCYYQGLKGLFGSKELHGLAHITGGGIQGNLNRVLPGHLDAKVELGKIKILPIFSFIKEKGNVSDGDMLRTFNLSVGMVAVASRKGAATMQQHLNGQGYSAYPVGEIVKGAKKVVFSGTVKW